MDLSYILNELGEEHSEYFNAVAPPIIQTSNFLFNTVDDLRKAFADEYDAILYSRGNNPTIDILRKKLAALDGAEDCLVFNSGASAIFCSVLPFVKAGDHIVSVKAPYTWAKKLFDVILKRFDVTTTYIDGTDIANWQAAVQPNTTIFYLESPNSWTYELQDLSAVAALAKANHITTIIDNSYCSPLYQKPIAFGIDLVLQSATKYIGGHSDVVAGVLTGSHEKMAKIFNSEYLTTGSGCTPFHAWLLLRGLRTLPMRLAHITNTTGTMIAWLKQHSKVETVIFPFDEDFKQYELAKQQMKGACGLVTIVLKSTTFTDIENCCNHLKHIKMAVSWGGHESLLIPRLAGIKKEHFNPGNREHRMLRLYIGLEEAAYLQADLDQAFTYLH
ncbi:MAG: PLP-dependent aspartate aminotransferase family protein [Bacteroidota bacterium]